MLKVEHSIMNKHSIQVILTDACNWTCENCGIRPRKPKLEYDFILEHIESIFKNHKHQLKHLNLSGGEPGLMPDKFWIEIINLIHQYDMKDQVDLQTNGLMFKHSKIIDELIDSINSVKWHTIENFNYNISLTPTILRHKDQIQQIIIYKESNLLEFIKWLNTNKDNILDDFLIVLDTNYESSMSGINKINNIVNMFNSKYDLNIKVKDNKYYAITKKHRNQCMRRYTTIRVDYVKNIITPCCKITDSNLEINEFNLNQIMSNQICVYSDRCFQCKKLMDGLVK